MKKIILVFLAIILFSLPSFAGDLRPVDWIVAVVDADIITFTQFVEEMRVESARRGVSIEQLTPEQKNQLGDAVMEKLLTEALLVQEARRQIITVTPAEIEKEAQDAMSRLRQQFVDQAAFERALAAEFTTPERINERYRNQAEAQLLRTKLINQEIKRKIKITDSDILSAYQTRAEEVHVRHILVADSKLAESIRIRLSSGEKFEDVASSVTALEAADLGWVRRGTMVEAFENSAFALMPNQTSDVVKTRYGYHVIQLIERKKSELPPLSDDIKERVFNELYTSKFDSMLENFVDSIREHAYVEIREASLEPLF
ncbi:TPA: hypothetical protein DEF17_07035 [bacterium]|nr:MAG: hypothetical protein AUJ18_05140 [Candidatus Hydrogenedentes bacterium CG1_02_42_14]HBW47669.1 hypothetical protein [bacterium]